MTSPGKSAHPWAGQPMGEGHPSPVTPFREKLWQVVSTPLGRMMWTIHRSLLFCSVPVLIPHVRSGSAVGPYLSKNHFCGFWSANADIAGLGVCRSCCPRAPAGSQGRRCARSALAPRGQLPASRCPEPSWLSAKRGAWQHCRCCGFVVAVGSSCRPGLCCTGSPPKPSLLRLQVTAPPPETKREQSEIQVFPVLKPRGPQLRGIPAAPPWGGARARTQRPAPCFASRHLALAGRPLGLQLLSSVARGSRGWPHRLCPRATTVRKVGNSVSPSRLRQPETRATGEQRRRSARPWP